MSKRVRAAAEQVASLAPSSQAYKPSLLPHIGIDEGLQSRRIWKMVCALVGQGLASGGVTLWTEMYLDPDGSIATIPERTDHRKALKLLRSNPQLRRMPCPDTDIVTVVLAHLYTERHFVVLSADLGVQRDGLRSLLSNDVADVIEKEPRTLGLTLLLKKGTTPERDYVARVEAFFMLGGWQAGFSEILI